jgi:hypothetical protein
MVDADCKEEGCDSHKHIALLLPGENRVLVCARLGCPGHRLEMHSAPGGLIEKVSDINFFGAFVDDYFGGI